MSNVNADATQLLTILKNMRTSISSIETTRSSVKMKYQQLGIGWNDKKYDELGTIVKDCNKALNDILQIMLQAEKYVASLAKSVQEYDNVNLDTPSARNSFLQGLQTPNVGNSSYQYCLGVLTQGSTPDGYIAVISQRHENAEQNDISAAQLEVIEGNIIDDKAVQDKCGYECYDIVCANILADVLEPLSAEITQHMKQPREIQK